MTADDVNLWYKGSMLDEVGAQEFLNRLRQAVETLAQDTLVEDGAAVQGHG